MARERIVIESDSKIYFVRPPEDQNVIGAILVDDLDSKGFVFVVPVENREIVAKTHKLLNNILNSDKLAIVESIIGTLTIDLERGSCHQFEVVGPQKLIIGSDF